MLAATCDLGIIYAARHAGCFPVAYAGCTEPFAALESYAFFASLGADELALVEFRDTPAIDGWPQAPGVASFETSRAAYAVAVPIRRGSTSDLLGVLMLGSTHPRADLTGAQSFVLGTIATQLLGASPSSATERLALLESAVMHARDSILITEAEPIDFPGPRILYCNPAFTEATGYSESEVVGRTPRILHGLDTDYEALKALKAALRAWQPVEIELLNYRKDGTPFWVELSIVPVADASGWFTHWVSVQRDTTERRAAHAAAIRAHTVEQDREALKILLEQRRRAEEALIHASTHDELTQLGNRGHIVRQIDARLHASAPGTRPCGAVFYLDLDGFKLVNDTHGHAVGDGLLVEIAARLPECIPASAVPARIAGDEFVIFFSEPAADADLEKMAQRVCDALIEPFETPGHTVAISCSIGIVRLTADYQNAEQVLRHADAAMYAAKRDGRAGFRFFHPAILADAAEALSLQSDLKAAVRARAFDVHYQPIFHTPTGAISGVEALIRWNHPRRGSVPASDFIPIAEQTGLIGAIDRWVRTRAFHQFAAWQRSFPGMSLILGVNVSAIELRDESFLDELDQTARAAGFSLSNLQIEITEGIFLVDSPVTTGLLIGLRNRGVSIALDDFGTGYSSLAYIDRYQIDTLKIDRIFVQQMLHKPRTMTILRGMVQLAGDLQLSLIAEGVETTAQFDALAAMGCTYMQGFLLGKPVAAQGITDLLMARS